MYILVLFESPILALGNTHQFKVHVIWSIFAITAGLFAGYPCIRDSTEKGGDKGRI